MRRQNAGFTIAEVLTGVLVGSLAIWGVSKLLVSIVSQAAQSDNRLGVTELWTDIERELNAANGSFSCKQSLKAVSANVESSFELDQGIWSESGQKPIDYTTINRIRLGAQVVFTEGQRVNKSWILKEISWKPMMSGPTGSESPYKVDLGSDLIQFRGHLTMTFERDKGLAAKRVFSSPLGLTVKRNATDVIDCATKVVNPVVTAVGARWAFVLGGITADQQAKNNRCSNVTPTLDQLFRTELNANEIYYQQWCDCFGAGAFEGSTDPNCQKKLSPSAPQCSSTYIPIQIIDAYFPKRRSDSRSGAFTWPTPNFVTDDLREAEGRCPLKSFSSSSGTFQATDVLSFPENGAHGQMNMGCKEGWFITSCTSGSNGMNSDIRITRHFENEDSKTGEYCSVPVKPEVGNDLVLLTVSCGRSQ